MGRRTVPIVALFVVTLISLGSTAQQDQDPPDPMSKFVEEDMKRFMAEIEAGPQPDTEADNWRQLTDDIGLVVARDDAGLLRGRLFMHDGGLWYPIAVDGPQQLGPRFVPAR